MILVVSRPSSSGYSVLLVYLSVLVLQLQLSADVELVFARGTVTPEQQKKFPLTQTQEEEHVVNGDETRPFTTLQLENEKPVCSCLTCCFQKIQL